MEMTEMIITEHVLQDYLFDMSDWLNKNKTINQSNALKNKAGMLAMIEAEYQHYLDNDLDDLAQDYATALEMLQLMSEQEFTAMRQDILSWAPTKTLL
ncbi:Hypothetical protein, transposon associated [Streptococcus mutans 3SN1]|uniref:hypothetical protein n=1 Tax=Streptococcus mutans TaxID=1309 RepID=UPI0002B5E8C5|nr:hypothetical protein [Streptococcus mutans]EMB67382.1 Hypothetical protein, transposon associated [Streptococcus mutans 3SN1]